MAPINLAEIAALDIDGVLPSRGMLYFFYELETMDWGFEPKDRGCARVIYYEGGPAGLIETEPPGDLKADYLVPEIPISFKNRDEVPDYEEFREQFGEGIDWDTYEEERTLRGCKASEEPEKVTKLLGLSLIHIEMCIRDRSGDCLPSFRQDISLPERRVLRVPGSVAGCVRGASYRSGVGSGAASSGLRPPV